MDIPACPKHGEMQVRKPGTPEQAWCGTWYECKDPRCMTAALIPSAESIDQNNDLFSRKRAAKGGAR